MGRLSRLARAATLLALALAGCTTSESIDLSDGRQGYAIRCGGAVLDWSSCLEKAADQCGKAGYDVIRKGERAALKSFVSVDPHAIQETDVPVTDREMVIACKTPPAR